MPVMMGFSRQRKQLLEHELKRFVDELPQLGVLRMYLTGDLARSQVGPESELDLVVVQETDEPFHRRPDFFYSHLRPRVACRFTVYTPDEFDGLASDDAVINDAVTNGEVVIG